MERMREGAGRNERNSSGKGIRERVQEGNERNSSGKGVRNLEKNETRRRERLDFKIRPNPSTPNFVPLELTI